MLCIECQKGELIRIRFPQSSWTSVTGQQLPQVVHRCTYCLWDHFVPMGRVETVFKIPKKKELEEAKVFSNYSLVPSLPEEDGEQLVMF